jgi:hypothetical protein
MRPSGTPQELEQRRLRAVRLLAEGFSPVEVARQIGVDRRSVRRWKAATRKGGASAVAAKAASGRPRRLAVVRCALSPRARQSAPAWLGLLAAETDPMRPRARLEARLIAQRSTRIERISSSSSSIARGLTSADRRAAARRTGRNTGIADRRRAHRGIFVAK